MITTIMPTQSTILLFDFLTAGADDGLADGIEPDIGGVAGPEGLGAAGSDGGDVCVGGCGLACGSIR